MYHEYSPALSLQGLVDCYWSSKSLPGDPPQKILPDGCVDIIFHFGKPLIVGTMTYSFESIQDTDIAEMIGIRFRPAGISAFIRTPVYEFTNLQSDFDTQDTVFDRDFYEELPYLSSTISRISYIERYLLKRLECIYIPDRRIVLATKMIIENHGQRDISKIVNYVCLSERQFERCFKAAVGISPKTFSQVARFRHTRRYLKAHPDESLFSVAMACGYFDHSHLIKDFRRFGNESPGNVAGV